MTSDGTAPPFTADELADALLVKLAEKPGLLDDLAARIADRLAAASPASHDETPAQDRSDGSDVQDVQAFAQWMMANHGSRISGDPRVWSARISDAAGKVAAQDIFEWSYSDAARTSFWRDLEGPIEPPKNTRTKRAGIFTQMRDEYSASLAEPDVSAHIDTVVGTVSELISHYAVREFTQLPVNARKSALGLLRDSNWDVHRITTVITYALAKRPYWRSNTNGIPSQRTFARMRGDWLSASDTYNRQSLPAEHHASVEKLTEGWCWYFGHRVNVGGRRITATDTTRRRVADCLTGADGAGPISESRIEEFIVWVCGPTCASAGYLISGVDFPALSQVRRGLLQMTTKRSAAPARIGAGISDTNAAAAGTIVGVAAVSEV